MSSKSSPSGDSHFVIVGGQRCGTTYLYTLLDEHPQVEMARPVRPEPKFFLAPDAVEAGIEAYRARHFGHRPDARAHGEKGTSYLETPGAAEWIAAVLPGSRIVALVRDPVERAISNHRFSVAHGLETLPVDEALTEEAERRPYDAARVSASPFAYLRRGRYAELLEPYLARFGRDRVFVGVFEELVAGPAVYDELCDALGVDRFAPPSLGSVVNEATVERGDVADETVARLRAHFEPSVRRLEELLGRDLDAWRQA